MRIGVNVASFISLGTDPVIIKWWLIVLSKMAIELVTYLCMAKGSEYIGEQLRFASRMELISESGGRKNS